MHDPRPRPGRAPTHTHRFRYTVVSNMAAQQQQQQEQQLEGIHIYKISPPRVTGQCNTLEEWKYKMTAYLGLQDPAYDRLLKKSDQSQLAVTNDQLETAAPSQAIAKQWIQLSSYLHYLLVSTCDGPASTICRQNMQGNGFETWRLIHARYSKPLGTRSIAYLTRLLKPQLDEQKFKESFKTWEFQLSRYKQDNNTLLPDAVKIATLLNETTKGPLQQHLQLQAGNITTYAQIRSMVIEYYRATAFTRLQAITSSNNNQGPTPMDIGATWYNKGKGKKGKHKGKGKRNKGKGYGSYGNNFGYSNYKGGKGKYNRQPVGQGNPFKGQQGYGKAKGYSNKGKGTKHNTTTTSKEEKEQKDNTQQTFATDVDSQDTWAIYSCDTGTFNTNDQTDDW